jgi:predicted AlkP superfamily pyrophosphatase or phosphodiesterase
MVLLVSIDGLMPRSVLEADSLGLALPHLKRLVREGTFATGVRGVVPSLTYPAHTTLLTGTSPARHGILMNLPFDPMGQNQEGWYWYARDIRDSTLWGVSSQAGQITANVYWPVSVGAPVRFNLVQYWRGLPSEDRKLYAALSTPNLLDEMEKALGPLPYGGDFGIRADETRARFVEYLVLHQRPRLTTAYFASFDESAHWVGPSGQAAFKILERLDALIGRLWATLESAAPNDFVLAVVSDHGFLSYTQEVELGALLRQRGLLELGSDERVTWWKAAPWVAGGTGAIVLKDQNDQATRQMVESLLVELQATPDHGVAKVFRGREIEALRGFSGVDYVIALRPGFKFGKKLTGPFRVDKAGGTHGYLPDEPGMDAALFLVGRGVARGRSLGRVDLCDVAPTIASLLGLSLTAAEGRNLLSASPTAENSAAAPSD